jgi:hypothetical protein
MIQQLVPHLIFQRADFTVLRETTKDLVQVFPFFNDLQANGEIQMVAPAAEEQLEVIDPDHFFVQHLLTHPHPGKDIPAERRGVRLQAQSDHSVGWSSGFKVCQHDPHDVEFVRIAYDPGYEIQIGRNAGRKGLPIVQEYGAQDQSAMLREALGQDSFLAQGIHAPLGMVDGYAIIEGAETRILRESAHVVEEGRKMSDPGKGGGHIQRLRDQLGGLQNFPRVFDLDPDVDIIILASTPELPREGFKPAYIFVKVASRHRRFPIFPKTKGPES